MSPGGLKGNGLALFGLVALTATQMAGVAPFNFYGFDDWTVHYLVSRGIVDVPYSNRPMELIWELPARLLAPHSFAPYGLLFASYAALSSWIVYLLCLRLVGGSRALAYVAAGLTLVWAPRDLARLSCFERTMYTSFLFGTLLAFLLFVESWRRQSASLLTLSILVAFVTARSYEATIGLILGWPFFVSLGTAERSRRFWTWAAAWEAFAVLALALIVQPLLFPTGPSYQLALGMDLDPGRTLGRILNQLNYEVAPLVRSPSSELLTPYTLVAVLVFSLPAGVFLFGERESTEPRRSTLLFATLGGLLLACLGFSVLALSSQRIFPPAWRMQILAGPGIGLFLGALIVLVAFALPARVRRAAVLVAASFVVAVGTGRTVAMQRVWDGFSFYSRQVRMLRDLTAIAPDLKPNTLVVAVDRGGAWRQADWGFRHAVQYLYEDRAQGYVWNSVDFMFPTQVTQAGIVCVPWPDVQKAWNTPPTLSRFDELVVVVSGDGGETRLAREWPATFPPLPKGARYEPQARIVEAKAPVPARQILHSSFGD